MASRSRIKALYPEGGPLLTLPACPAPQAVVVVVPAPAHQKLIEEDFAGWPEPLKEYARTTMRGAATFVDVMEATIPG
jgi:hypothetical protein